MSYEPSRSDTIEAIARYIEGISLQEGSAGARRAVTELILNETIVSLSTPNITVDNGELLFDGLILESWLKTCQFRP